MTTTRSPLCLTCRHRTPDPERPRCEAYPEGIPGDIFWEGYDHRRPFPGDRGITYDPIRPGDAERHGWPPQPA
jgi:hypothetical protein